MHVLNLCSEVFYLFIIFNVNSLSSMMISWSRPCNIRYCFRAPAPVTPNTEEVKRKGGGARGRGVRGCTIRRTIVNDYEPSQNAHRPSPPKMNDLDEVLQR